MRVEVGFGNKKFNEIHCSEFLSIPSTISYHSVICLRGLKIGFVFMICKMKATITAVCQMNRILSLARVSCLKESKVVILGVSG